MNWSQKDTERVKAAHKEALDIMGRYAEAEALMPAYLMQDGRIPDPDSVIQNLCKLAHSHLKSMIFLEEAEHTTTNGPSGIEVTLHYAKGIDWFDCTLDIPEKIYTHENIAWAKWLADKIHKEAMKDRNNGKLNNSNKRQNITWDHVKQAVESVNSELINDTDTYRGQGKTYTFDMISEELSAILQAEGNPAIKKTTFNRWIESTKRKRQDVFDLFTDEAMKIIKNR